MSNSENDSNEKLKSSKDVFFISVFAIIFLIVIVASIKNQRNDGNLW